MEINGIDVDALTPDNTEAFPNVVPGRVLQLDGDVLVYQCSYDNSDTIDQCVNNYFSAVEYRRKMIGAEHVNIHLTSGDKGGRFEIATLKEYQIQRRKAKAKQETPVNLPKLKMRLSEMALGNQAGPKNTTIIHHSDQEADDGMAQGNYAVRDTPELSVIMSIDKDLCMCSGWHCDWDSFEMTFVDGFGSIYLDDSKSTKKIKGFGTSFFWAQLLMGDDADSIPGVVKIGYDVLNEVDPTKQTIKDLETVQKHTMQSTKYKAAWKRLISRKPKACGAVLAYKILKDVTSDREALEVCVRAYRSHYGPEHSYDSWDGRPMTKTVAQMLLEQAELLWMRRVHGESVRAWFKDVTLDGDWNGRIVRD